jgi:SAM-dependent methyltransferase
MTSRTPAHSEIRRLLPHLSELREGYGSAYERYAVGRLMETLVTELGVRTLIEWPANGVLGVPGLKSLPIACSGVSVTLLNPSAALLKGALEIWSAAGAPDPSTVVADPEDPGAVGGATFDLVWSFCAFEHARDPAELARAMVGAARGHVLVFVQNAWMPGVHVHRLHHRASAKPWDHGSVDIMRAEVVAEHLRRAGAEIVRLGGCDLPPWPDIDVRLPRPARIEASLKGGARPYGPGDPVLSPADAASIFRKPARLSTPMKWLAEWHDAVEARLPSAWLRWLAHHPYVLAKRIQ